MTCIIIEDQPPAQRLLKKYIDDIGTLQLRGTFADAIEAMEFLNGSPVDLIFLDIHLPKLSGIDFLKTMSHPPAVILTTAFPDYALESYELDVVDYLLKPFSFQRFVKAIGKVPQRKTSEGASGTEAEPNLREIFVKSGYEHIRVKINDILYIRSDADYTELITTGKKLLTSESLRQWLEKLDHFVQVHKSYIINPNHIVKVAGNQIYLPKEHAVPIGRAYKEAFVRQFLQ
ncbi:MAG: LytTR family DNA-binding domain-containing protein [Bacteroidota bacterium]